MSVTRIGHASVLLDLGGFRALTEGSARDASETRIGHASVLLDLGGFRALTEAPGRDATDLPAVARKLGTGERRLQRRLPGKRPRPAVLEEARHEPGFTRSS